MCACTSSAAARPRSCAASTPSGWMPTVVVCPACRTVRAARSTSAPSTASQQSRNAPAQRSRVEPGVVGAENALQNLARHVVGQQREIVRRRPRGVREVRDRQVRAALARASAGPGSGGSPAPSRACPRPAARLPRPARRRTRRCRRGTTPIPGGTPAPNTGWFGVSKSRWWMNHRVELATPL